MVEINTLGGQIIDFDDEDNEGLGDLLIADSRLLVRPRTTSGYPANARHDTSHAYSILAIGNDMGRFTTHIVHVGDAASAHQLLDRVFHYYIDACCFELWCDARVDYAEYQGGDRAGKTALTKEYGFDDGQYTQRFYVYCVEDKDVQDELFSRLVDDSEDAFITVDSLPASGEVVAMYYPGCEDQDDEEWNEGLHMWWIDNT